MDLSEAASRTTLWGNPVLPWTSACAWADCRMHTEALQQVLYDA